MTRRTSWVLPCLVATSLLLGSSIAFAQGGNLIQSINAAGKAARAGEATSGLARLIEIAGAEEVNALKAALEGGGADAQIMQALRDNAFLPPSSDFGTAITGQLSGGTITDRVSGMQYRVVRGSPTGWNGGDLFGYDGKVVTLWGQTGTADGQPAIAYTLMSPGENASYVHGRLRGEVVDGKPVISSGTANGVKVVVDNPQLAALMSQWASQGRGGVGVIVPGQIVSDGNQLLLRTGGETGVPDIPQIWVLTDIYGNGFGRADLGNGQYLYNAEVYGTNKSLVTVGPGFPNERKRHAVYGQPVESLEALPGVEPREYTAEGAGVQPNTSWDVTAASMSAGAEAPRRFIVASHITPDLADFQYATGALDPGSNVARLENQLIDPGAARGADGTQTASTPAGADVQEALNRGGS